MHYLPGNTEEGVELLTKLCRCEGVGIFPSAGAVPPHVVFFYLQHNVNYRTTSSQHNPQRWIVVTHVCWLLNVLSAQYITDT